MLAEWLDRAHRSALEGPGPEWDALVTAFGLVPLSAEQREVIRRSGVPRMKGVTPVELRVVLEAMKLRAAAERSASAMELETFVERELLRFVAAAQPPKLQLKGIFANAGRSAVRSTSGADSVSALACACCGAARPAGSDLRVCTFCGSALL